MSCSHFERVHSHIQVSNEAWVMSRSLKRGDDAPIIANGAGFAGVLIEPGPQRLANVEKIREDGAGVVKLV